MSGQGEAFRIKQAEFVTSVGASGPSGLSGHLADAYPPEAIAEIAIVGKSNVGKSSLINSLCNNQKLARVSQTPGKTRLINYFRLNRAFYLVDLPGYGFAKAPKTEQQAWGKLMEDYLSSGRVTHLFLLLDIRHMPTAEDMQMFRWMVYYGVPYTLVATKADKITRSKRQQSANAAAKALGAPPYALPYSTEIAAGREGLLTRIGQILEDAAQKEQPEEE